MVDQRSFFRTKIDAAQRYRHWHFTQSSSHIFVTEFPKSGGTWFCQMMSEITHLPFPRNENVKSSPSILLGHYISGKKNSLHILRDGRDVMVSAYYYFLLNRDTPSWIQLKWRKKMQAKKYENVKENLPHFIKVFFECFRTGLRNVRWDQFVYNYLPNDLVLTIKYEDLQVDPPSSLLKALNWLNLESEPSKILEAIEKYSFQNQSKKEEDTSQKTTFLRKGIVGDWKNHFTTKSAEVFDLYAGDALILAGYERNRKWY